MAKRDIKSAFRLLPISPIDFSLLGLKDEDGNIYIDKFLPMGCEISSALFEKFSTFLNWLVEHLAGRDTLDHYLDDFIFGGASGTQDCQLLLDTFTDVCRGLSVPLAEEKSIEPCTNLIFLGLELDSELMVIRIPLQKLTVLRSIIDHIINQKKVILREFQSFVGKLSFFSRAVRSSRAFIRRFYDAMVMIKKPHHRIRITKEMREDLYLWVKFLDHFNGVTHIPDLLWFKSECLNFFTDSAGASDLGCGCFFQNEWCFLQWPATWHEGGILTDITFLEMVPVLLAITLWGERIQQKKIILYIDNESLVSVINKQSSKSKRVMYLVRHFVLLALDYEILFKARHIPTHCNDIADSISRKQWDRFRSLVPAAAKDPRAIPERFLSIMCGLNQSVY